MGDAVLGIDPGTRKVGFAIALDRQGAPLAQGIEPLETLLERLRALLAVHGARAIALGGGTHAAHIGGLLGQLALPVYLIDEKDTTYRARALYFADHPPRGLRRLLPLGLQVPPHPIDDYAALLIARRFLEEEDSGDRAVRPLKL